MERCTQIQHYVKKFVNDLWQVGGFLWFPPLIKLTDITEILLKVALSTIKLNQTSKKLKFNLRVELKSHMKKSKGNKINTV